MFEFDIESSKNASYALIGSGGDYWKKIEEHARKPEGATKLRHDASLLDKIIEVL